VHAHRVPRVGDVAAERIGSADLRDAAVGIAPGVEGHAHGAHAVRAHADRAQWSATVEPAGVDRAAHAVVADPAVARAAAEAAVLRILAQVGADAVAHGAGAAGHAGAVLTRVAARADVAAETAVLRVGVDDHAGGPAFGQSVRATAVEVDGTTVGGKGEVV